MRVTIDRAAAFVMKSQFEAVQEHSLCCPKELSSVDTRSFSELPCFHLRAHPDLNQGPADLQSAALTTELCTQANCF